MVAFLSEKFSIAKLKLIGIIATAPTFVLLLYFFFEPHWLSNDDIGMSMAAHGYGMAAIGTPHLIFSNILWGYLVRCLPTIHGTVGYSIATLCILNVIGIVIISSLFYLKNNYLTCLSVFVLLLTHPILFPDFTINSGLLFVATILLWCCYAKNNNWKLFLLGTLLAFFSYLVRSREFWFVFFIALPLLPWQVLLSQRSFKITIVNFVLLFSAIATSSWIDYRAYQRKEWQSFNEFNPLASQIVDFSFGEHLRQHPSLLANNGYTSNDINLLEDWFFVDPNLANPIRLNAMIRALGLVPSSKTALQNGWIGVKNLWHPRLLLIVCTALLLAFLRPTWRVATSWGVFSVCIFILGFLGRPGVLRVYLPVLDLLVLGPLIIKPIFHVRRSLPFGILLIAATIGMISTTVESRKAEFASQKMRHDLIGFPNSTVIVWGARLPYEKIYPVLGGATTELSYRFYALGGFTLAPFSVAYAEQKANRGVIDLLHNKEYFSIIASENDLNLLKDYCKEHLKENLKEIIQKKYGNDIAVTLCQGETLN